MEVYDNPFSPYAFKVRAALYEKNAPHEKREIQKRADHAKLLRVNPRGEVPCIVEEGVAISDSKVICAWLEERFPEPPLLPRDPLARARCRYLELKSDNEIDPAVLVLGILKTMKPELARDVPESLPKTEQALARHYAYLERELAGRDWFLGDFSLVDIALTPHLRSAAFLGCPPGDQHPALSAWLARGAARPSLKRAMRELAEGFAASQQPDSIFDPNRLHWRDTRIEFALRVGLGPWLLSELAKDRAFLSPIP
ncbi:MAG TPA: glutathione S-transferase family protein [Myxococcota bacterium]|jgi:glutathione S-transferase